MVEGEKGVKKKNIMRRIKNGIVKLKVEKWIGGEIVREVGILNRVNDIGKEREVGGSGEKRGILGG